MHVYVNIKDDIRSSVSFVEHRFSGISLSLKINRSKRRKGKAQLNDHPMHVLSTQILENKSNKFLNLIILSV